MHNANLPKHRYVWVSDSFVAREPEGKLLPGIWFGVSSHPGRAFGCHVLLECGATVIDLPLHSPRWKEDAHLESMDLSQAVQWDSFGWNVEVFESSYLSGLDVSVLSEDHRLVTSTGTAWFALDWIDNGWSNYPEQHKWLWVVATASGDLMAVPQDRLLFSEASFTAPDAGLPRGGIKRQTQIWSAE